MGGEMQIGRAGRIVCRLPVSYGRMFATSNKEAQIRSVLEKEFQPTHLEVVDHSGGCPGGTLEVEIHSAQFEGKRELQRHRMVNKAIKDEISQFHAFVLRTFPVQKKE